MNANTGLKLTLLSGFGANFVLDENPEAIINKVYSLLFDVWLRGQAYS